MDCFSDSLLVLLFWPIPKKTGLVFWIFSQTHQRIYDSMTDIWNQAQPQEDRVHLLLLSGFLSGTPLPSLVEAYAFIVAQVFKGPLEDVGFAD
jgi:hypothetical protein